MEHEDVIRITQEFVKKTLAGSDASHDWWHVYRVWKLSKDIAKTEKADMFVVELGALLHDIADYKADPDNERIGPKKARDFLKSLDIKEEIIVHVENIISNISFKGPRHEQRFKSPELDIVQDADRLDALGAIGIARAFNYGGHKNRNIHDPETEPNLDMTVDEHINKNTSTVNHFYEKLLLLKDRMNTKTGRSIAEKRHEFMKNFLDEFYKEWDGKA